MKHLTIITLALFALLLTYKISLPSTYQEVKQDMIAQGYKFPKLWFEHIEFFWDSDNFYGMNPSMGSYTSNVTILINYNAWIKMNKVQRKLLILHEMIHSLGKDGFEHHCSAVGCVMSPASIDVYRNADYEKILRNTMLHHNLIGKSSITLFRF